MSRQGRQAGHGAAQSDPAPPLQSAADRAMIRLEVLRLTHRHDLDAAQIIARATALTAWVAGEQPGDKPEF